MEAQFTSIKAKQNKLLRKIIHTLIPIFIFTIHCQIFYAQECVIIIQGYEDGNESFASNTADVVETAMSKLPGGAKVTRLAPSKTNKSKMKPTLYKNKAELLKEFETALCKQECQNVILFFIGHGMGGDGINGAPKKNTDGGMWVDNTNKTQNSDFITAAEVAAIIDKCKKYVKLVDNHCYASAMTNGVLENLQNKNLLRIGLSSSKWNEKSYFSKPADASAQYYFFMVEFLKDYYKIIGDPNVMEQIKNKAEELKKQAEANNAENAAKRAEIQKQIDALNAELQKNKDSLKELEKEKKTNEEKLEKYKGISNDIDNINKLKDEYDQLKKDQVELGKTKTKDLKDATADANKAADEIKKDKKLSSKEKTDKISDLSKELKTKTDSIKDEFKKKMRR
ncbi:MAG: hypothetical protein IPN29_08810 [Saprospiraceae bacterium]|nr:hypothetical protein [Saprospiraceae bacterium]